MKITHRAASSVAALAIVGTALFGFVGEASAAGVGHGKAVGQPCAGCVGNADDKAPPGQALDGTDANAGYECDTNNGIGKTNPAHTGCETGGGGGGWG